MPGAVAPGERNARMPATTVVRARGREKSPEGEHVENTDKAGDSLQIVREPVFLQQPDGSLAQGVPPGYEEPRPPSTPRQRFFQADGVGSISADLVGVLARHDSLFFSLLLLQLVVECGFEVMHLRHREEAVIELSLWYSTASPWLLRCLYYMASGAEFAFSLAYFAIGVLAVVQGNPKHYHTFSTVALIGTLAQLPLAYLNRFNLLIFFLRFIGFAYARFQCNLLHGLHISSDGLAQILV